MCVLGVFGVCWAGPMEGLADGEGLLSATSQILPDGVGLLEFFASMPFAMNIQGMDELLEFNGISLDMILAGLSICWMSW